MLKCFFLLFVSVSCLLTNIRAIDVSAKSAILFEPVTKTVLYEKDSFSQREIASTTKIMTAVVVLKNASLSDVITVPKNCTGIEGTSMYLKENEKISVSDLLYGLLLQSGNDAAVALATYVGNGDVAAFVEMMNETAYKLGMKNTSFKNPNGLPEEGHVSSAYDMALLAAYAMDIPEFAEIVSTKQKQVAGRTLTNHNKLLRMYDGANGIKTGFTKRAGRCLVSSAERDDMKLIAVTLSAPDDWSDHRTLLDYGFNNYSVFSSPDSGSFVAEIPVISGECESVSAVTCGKVIFLTSKASNNSSIKQEIFLPRFLYAPVHRGDVIGEIRYFRDDGTFDSVSLVSETTVEIEEKNGLINKIFSFFRR